ncbi:variably expressed lipoprotein and hemagglutinin (VlhA) family protein domain protein [Mycoplasmoides gallisepticum CA06_2006.052-5-2P]|nr:variably expressed lipoprotein and hemagglutinin (VlhA) family protein domain protein [Mycoplasmoides gallisepticum NC96_1596-4-2P]AFP80903.1 variably expressed lipoprotein and hemagglutinin (VlhA) family protein domain protein [Mycoplasmoides gallisepticum CA06_2006.052-5-2P]
MKRKNILKFVSLLGIGSFVMLAAASCTSATTPTPNPEPKPNPAPKPDPMPNPGGGMMGGMNGGNTNPGNGGGTDNAAQQLAAAKKELSDLLATQNSNLSTYADYANIQNTITAAYTTAKSTSDNTSATLEQVKSATSTLQTAIDTAASSKTSFDEKNPELIKAYNALKETLKNEETVLGGLTDSNFATIKTNLTALYKSGKDIVTKTLDPIMGTAIDHSAVTQANTNISNATSKLEDWKTNANTLATSFVKEVLVKNKLTGIDTTNNQEQPGNYSFVGYSVDVTTGSNNARPNWNFAQRKVWTSEGQNGGSTILVETPISKTDVSWIYNLKGTGTKYTLNFNYYGPSTAYLYFPYKLVKTTDAAKVALQYKLNNGAQKLIQFAPSSTTTDMPSTREPTSPRSSSLELVNDQNTQTSNQTDLNSSANKTPAVADINVAKVTLTDLNFGQNTIELSLPEGDKVSPMIGNIYITSNDQNNDKVYDDIFGNTQKTIDNKKSVTVDLLTGYSLVSGWSTYVGQFKKVSTTGQAPFEETNPNYLIGFIGGSNQRLANNVSTPVRNPSTRGATRTLTIYVNAPETGEYYIKGSYLTNTARRLKLSTSSTDSSTVTITNLMKANWNTLGNFDTSKHKLQ